MEKPFEDLLVRSTAKVTTEPKIGTTNREYVEAGKKGSVTSGGRSAVFETYKGRDSCRTRCTTGPSVSGVFTFDVDRLIFPSRKTAT